MPVNSERRLDGLDALRGIAAASVVFCHVVFLGNFPVPDGARPPAAHATLAVELFFVLSAFSLCVGYHEALRDGASVGRYFLRRWLRIAPLFFAMLAAWIGFRLSLGRPPPDPAFLLANVAFVFGLFPGWQTSLVPAGWSIGIEMLFYLLFPAVIFVIRGLRSALLALAVSLAAGWAFLGYLEAASGVPRLFLRMNLVTQLPCFMSGVAAFFVYLRLRHQAPELRRRVSLALLAVAMTYWLAAVLMNDHLRVDDSYAWRLLVSAGFPALVLAVALHPVRIIANRTTIFIGVVSYSIYLTHPLVIVLMRSRLSQWIYAGLWTNLWIPLALAFSAIFVAVLLLSTATYLVIERPMMRLGQSAQRGAIMPVAT